MRRLAANNGLGLLDDLLTLSEDQLDVAGVRHVGVDLCMQLIRNPAGLVAGVDGAVQHTRPWAR